MSSHTPTPWHVNRALTRDGSALWANVYSETNDDSYNIIAHMQDGDKLANASFIVRAINAHEALVEALEAMLGINNPQGGEIGHIDYLEAVKLARAALAKAKD